MDEAKLTPDKHIETKYGLGTIRNLSSGCKTLLNLVKHPDDIVTGSRGYHAWWSKEYEDCMIER